MVSELLKVEILSILQFVLVLIIGFLVSKLINDFLTSWLKRKEVKKFVEELGYDEPLLDLIIVSVKYIIYFITFIIAVSQFGIGTFLLNMIILLIALLVVIFIIYSLRDFIPNAAAGIYLTKVKAIKVGDNIKIGVYQGTVKSINLFTTTIVDEEGKVTIIPNSILTKKEIVVMKKW